MALLTASFAVEVPPAQAVDFVPLTVTASTMWPQPSDGGLRYLDILARNDSGSTLTDVQTVVRFFDSHGVLIETRNSFGDRLERVGPGETVAVYALPSAMAATYSVDLVAGTPTATPPNRNFTVGTPVLTPWRSDGYRFAQVDVTNRNDIAAENVRAMFVCQGAHGVHALDGPTFGADLAPGQSTTLSQIFSVYDPPCASVTFVVVDSPSPPGNVIVLPPTPIPAPTPTVTASPSPTATPAKASSYLSLNVTPEPAKKGDTVRAKTTLRRASGPLAGKVVRFYFRAKGRSVWRYRAQAVTSSKGVAVRAFTARRTGDWRSRYTGSAVYRPDKAVDRVRVIT